MNSPLCLRTKWHKTVNCGCKINLRLKVTARRPDGLHDLSGCFVFLPFPGDVLSVSGGVGSLTLECPGFPELANEKNLLWLAAEKFASAAGIAPQWHMVLQKNVPIAAGLGGGSADAGALLTLLNEQYRALDEQTLLDLAFSLGADVPFFLRKKAAWVTGAGEKFEELADLPRLPEILIVNPGFPVSAKWAYTHLDKELIGMDDPALKPDFLTGRINWNEFCCNDLARAVVRKFPLLTVLKDFLISQEALAVQVSGSGPSLFALYGPGKASLAAAKLRERFAAMENLRIFTEGKEF